MTNLDSALDFLSRVDSPTVANAIEHLSERDRSDGYISGHVESAFPELGTMLGRAVTVTMTNSRGPVASMDGWWEMWELMDSLDGPLVLVIADGSGAPQRVAYAGEIMSRIAQRLGAVGIVTDGALRDVNEVRALGVHYFMRYPVVSHANFSVEKVGEPVVLGDQRIATGDLLHGDANGIVVVPEEVIPALPSAIEAVRAKEARDIALINSTDFSLERLKESLGYVSRRS
jgi:4-hydroxy-4-methyl-2-oxoglutarate aldolase